VRPFRGRLGAGDTFCAAGSPSPPSRLGQAPFNPPTVVLPLPSGAAGWHACAFNYHSVGRGAAMVSRCLGDRQLEGAA